MAAETLGIGLIIPALGLLSQPDVFLNNDFVRPLVSWFGSPSPRDIIFGAMSLMILLYSLKTVFLWFLTRHQAKFAFAVQAKLSQRLFVRYLSQPYSFHLRRNSAELIRNCNGEVGQYTTVLSSSIRLITELLVLGGIAFLLLVIEPLGVTVIAIVLGIASLIFHQLSRSKMKIWGVARQLHDGERIRHLQQALGGIKEVILIGCRDEFMSQYEYHTEKSAQAGRFFNVLQQLPRLWLEMLSVTGLAVLVMTLTWQGQEMSEMIPVLGLFGASAFRLMPSISRIIGSIQAITYGLPVIGVISNELALQRLSSDPKGDREKISLSSALELKQVSYSYEEAEKPTIRNIDLKIRAGETVGLIGASGSGKSTLVDLIMGLLKPTVGEVCVDGHNILHAPRLWQNQIGYVPQSIFLTDESLLRNIAFGVAEEEIDMEAVATSISSAQLDEFVAGLPDGLNTLVGERGVRVSGGQRQRIGIARALYRDPEVLVLDEATSSLDDETEKSFMKAVYNLHGQKTILIVAHRLSTVSKCDRIFRLQSGKISAVGSPSEML